MAALSITAFLSKWLTLFADNSTRDISEQDVRDFRQDIADSFLNIIDQSFNSIKGIATGVNTIAGLQAIGTTTLGASSFIHVVFRDTGNSDALRVYQLVAGTDAESLPNVVRPTDYNGSTNQKVWKLAVVGGASGIGSTTVSTASGTVTLPFDSNAIMVFKAVPAIDSPKVIAVTGDGNQLTYDFIVPITDVAGTLEFGAGVEFSGNDPRWDAGTEIWTADGEGTFWFRAVWDSNGSTWFVKVVESFYS